jgi:hypothetical protein
MRPVHGKCEHEDDCDNDQPVEVVSDEGRLDAAKEGVRDYADGEEEDGGFDGCPGEVVYHGRAASEEHCRYWDGRLVLAFLGVKGVPANGVAKKKKKAKDNVHNMGRRALPRLDRPENCKSQHCWHIEKT